MNLRQYIPDHAVTTVPALAILLSLHFFISSERAPDAGIELTGPLQLESDYLQQLARRGGFDADGEIDRLNIDDAEREQEIRDLLDQGEYKQSRTRLLEIAAAAVLQKDKSQLGNSLLMLGEVAIHQQELGAAEIYLQEALFIAMSNNDRLATARCYQQLGHLNIRARALARQASNTYDQLWQARNAISRGYYLGVAENLEVVIKENLDIRRFGAAADSWEALASLYDQTHDDYLAQQARIEAARLYASTGQYNRTRKLISGLDPGQISDGDLYQLKQEIEGLFQQHQQDLAQTAEARDYQMLYHHYRRLGDIERAWEFRIKSSQSLAKTTDRSMFQRQADVIAVLYNSNFAMERARRYLDQADTIFGDGDLQELLDETREMKILIF
jgi:hypothetical protein